MLPSLGRGVGLADAKCGRRLLVRPRLQLFQGLAINSPLAHFSFRR